MLGLFEVAIGVGMIAGRFLFLLCRVLVVKNLVYIAATLVLAARFDRAVPRR